FDSFVTIPLFLLRHFPLTDFIRFGLAGVQLRFSNNWKPLESITAAEWSRKHFGERLYDVLWRPMLVGKFGEENLDVVNMAWLWARLHTRTTRLGTFEGGFQAFMQTLADAVSEQGASIQLNTGARQIRQNPGGWTVETSGEPGAFDAVISTTSPGAMLRLAPDLPGSYRDQLSGLKNLGAVVMVLTLKERLTDAYWHNLPKEAGFPFLALVEHTNYIDRSHYGGDHIVYC
ncbi:MAG TPA: FAD-dependent oxidoreductase, partial [Anaerolineales bacterium]|nr:FAD-dependent oxidoreductase [Anaerolineales bacterium]